MMFSFISKGSALGNGILVVQNENKADRHKSRAHTKELTHIKTLYWPTLLHICILAHLHTCSLSH